MNEEFVLLATTLITPAAASAEMSQMRRFLALIAPVWRG
jgi:hypothetical protein